MFGEIFSPEHSSATDWVNRGTALRSLNCPIGWHWSGSKLEVLWLMHQIRVTQTTRDSDDESGHTVKQTYNIIGEYRLIQGCQCRYPALTGRTWRPWTSYGAFQNNCPLRKISSTYRLRHAVRYIKSIAEMGKILFNIELEIEDAKSWTCGSWKRSNILRRSTCP
jgi:hypothetical protein